MSPEFPEHLRESPRPSTWWVGRGSKPRPPWWRDAVFAVVIPVLMTIGFLMSDAKAWWFLVVVWAYAIGYVGWLYRCHLTGRDPADNRLDRWAEAHPVLDFVWWGIALALMFGLLELLD